jgi:ubiquinone/menaquinone biosynthesis C-methylase UbiE
MPEYGRHFDQVAPDYDALRREATDEVADWLVADGRLSGGGRLLDIGCGTGAMTRLLARRLDITAVGLDPSDEMLRRAKEEGEPRCSFVQGRAEELPFDSRSFDRTRDSPGLSVRCPSASSPRSSWSASPLGARSGFQATALRLNTEAGFP